MEETALDDTSLDKEQQANRKPLTEMVVYDMVHEFPMGNQSLTDIINLKQRHNLFIIVDTRIKRIWCHVRHHFKGRHVGVDLLHSKKQMIVANWLGQSVFPYSEAKSLLQY